MENNVNSRMLVGPFSVFSYSIIQFVIIFELTTTTEIRILIDTDYTRLKNSITCHYEWTGIQLKPVHNGDMSLIIADGQTLIIDKHQKSQVKGVGHVGVKNMILCIYYLNDSLKSTVKHTECTIYIVCYWGLNISTIQKI